MSKIRIVYATKTRHSKKLALAIGNAFNVRAENVSENPAPGETDLLFIIGGLYGGASLPELLDFVRKLDSSKVKNAVLVTSCASNKQGQDNVRKLLEEKMIPVLDEFICLGSFLLMKAGHPNKEEILAAVDFAVRLSERI